MVVRSVAVLVTTVVTIRAGSDKSFEHQGVDASTPNLRWRPQTHIKIPSIFHEFQLLGAVVPVRVYSANRATRAAKSSHPSVGRNFVVAFKSSYRRPYFRGIVVHIFGVYTP